MLKLGGNLMTDFKKDSLKKADQVREKDYAESGFNEIEVDDEGKEIVKTKNRLVRTIIIIMATIICGFHLYTSGFGTLSAMDQRGIHWLLVSMMVFIMYPSKGKFIRIFDVVCFVFAIISGLYIILTWGDIALAGSGARTTIDIVIGAIGVFIALEAARRTIGWVLPITAGIFLLYLVVGPYLPPSIGHGGYSLKRVISMLYYSTEGIYGVPIATSASFIVMFVMFGALLNKSGGGKFFIDFAFAIAGKFRGGSAKTAILSSMLMGSISGSPIANVVTTGTFTIPLMKKGGYKPEVAGAVEAVSSTGGQIMPPIMGAACFLMAEFTGISYAEIAWAALIPALFYYFAVYLIVDIEAVKMGIKGLPKSELPTIKESLKKGWHLLTPIIPLVYLIMAGYSPTKSVFFSILLMLAIYLIAQKKLIAFLRFLLEGFEGAVRSLAPVASACACAGLVVGIIQLTGLGLRLTTLISVISGGEILIALVFTMFASIILGMGLPTTVLYIVLASLAAPALIKMGVPVLTAHLFVFYYGCISTITPPVCLTSYAAAGIANSDPTKIGILAFKYGFAAYLIPFMMVYGPAILLVGSAAEITLAIITGLIGIYCLASSIQSFLFIKTVWISRLMLLVAAICLIKPGLYTDIVGISFFVISIIIQLMLKRKTISSSTDATA